MKCYQKISNSHSKQDAAFPIVDELASCTKQTTTSKGNKGNNAAYSFNTKDSVSSGFTNSEKRVENTACSGVFLTEFEVFG